MHPKAQITYDKVLAVVTHEFLDTSEIAALCGVSRPTAGKYLHMMVDRNIVRLRRIRRKHTYDQHKAEANSIVCTWKLLEKEDGSKD